MGYFARKLSRGRCGAQVRILNRQYVARPLRVVLPSDRPPRVAMGFLRFSAGGLDPDSKRFQGLFQAISDLEDQQALSDEEMGELTEADCWFDDNLPLPKLDEPRAIFWFNTTAVQCIQRMWVIARLLRAHGAPVYAERTAAPGRVVYRDAHQIAAVPPPGRRTRWRRCMV